METKTTRRLGGWILLIALLFSALACSSSGVGKEPTSDGDLGGCLADSDCKEGEFCAPDGLCYPRSGFPCISGICPLGFICEGGLCLSSGNAVSCAENQDCPENAACLGGYCWPGPFPAEDGDGQQQAQLSAPQLVDFGAAFLYTTLTREVEIISSGSKPLEIYSVLLDGSSDADYKLLDAPTASRTLQSGERLLLHVELTPTTPGVRAGKIILTSNDARSNTTSISLVSQYKGTAHLIVAPEAPNFGIVNVGNAGELTLTLRNSPPDTDSNRVVSVSALSINSQAAEFFKLGADAPPLPFIVAPGEHNARSLTLRYTPLAPIAQSATLTIVAEVGKSQPETIEIPLTGQGAAPILQTNTGYTISFGEVLFNRRAETEILLSNIGGGVLKIGDIQIVSASEPVFALDTLQAKGAELLPGQNTAIRIGFTPTAALTSSATLRIFSNSFGEPQSDHLLKGSGIKALIAAEPTPLAFPDTALTTQSTKTLTLSNLTESPIAITALHLESGLTEAFAFDSALVLPIALEAKGTSDIPIHFLPPSEDLWRGDLTIQTDRLGGDLVVGLSGRGVRSRLVLNPDTTLDLGEVVRLAQGKAILNISNTGTSALSIGGLSLDGAQSPLFTFSPNSLAPLAPLETRQIEVSVAPLAASALGPITQTLRMTSNDPDHPTASIALKATVVDPQLAISPSASPVEFGNVDMGQTKTINFIISNVGQGTLTISSLTLLQAPSRTDFTLNTNTLVFPQAVLPAPGASTLNFSIGVSPTDYNQTLSAELLIATNDRRIEGGVLHVPLKASSTACQPGTHRCGEVCAPNDSPATCGARCSACPRPTYSSTTCTKTDAQSDYVCGFTCDTGYVENEDECKRTGNIACCGSGCTVCPAAPANAHMECLNGSCTPLCNAGYHGCADGRCYQDTDVNHCGQSCTPCVVPAGGIAECVNGACQASCNDGRHFCADGNCYADNDTNHCGASCLSCAAPNNGMASCSNDTCVKLCVSGAHLCSNTCYGNADPAHCGPSCTRCGKPTYGERVCNNDACDFTCNAYYHRNTALTTCPLSAPDSCCLANSSDNCCGVSCSSCPSAGPHTAGRCVSGSGAALYACTLACETGYTDYDANLINGCECKFVSDTDEPGDGQDQNCDGIDGTLTSSIFVSKDGSDSNDGSLVFPVATINRGLALASSKGKAYVLITGERYYENVVLLSGISLLGGYSASFRTRDTTGNPTTLEGVATVKSSEIGTVTAIDINSATTELSGFAVIGRNATSAGQSSYGVYLRNCDAHFVLQNNTITAGDAMAGVRGNNGTAGTEGGQGGAGQAAKAAGSVAAGCTGTNSGGQGGQNASCAGQGGGQGGSIGCPVVLNEYQGPGTNGSGTTPGTGGAGSYSSQLNPTCTICNQDTTKKQNGSPGTGGTRGTDGAGGNGCMSAGSLDSDTWLWKLAAAQDGTKGTGGAGGGGGGAGGGVNIQAGADPCGTQRADTLGGSGGGGGAGGCAGTMGTAGTSGGSSFALFVVFTQAPSGVSALPSLTANTLVLGRGGAGGSGGSGGAGGAGGAGGISGADGTGYLLWCAGSGGAGGSGGRGGHAGGGGGGCGGSAYGLYVHGAGGVSLAGYKSANSFDDTQGQAGQAGPGGFGGFADNAGKNGASGALAATNF